ncbi:Putative tartrate transporter, partial [Termitomyces sp. J132]
IDVRIIPWLCFTYLVMKTDANNITNSAIMNAEKKHDIKSELNLSPNQWNWVIACFFYPYAFLEPASTLMMKKTTPSFWLGRLMVTWGIICGCVGAVQKYGDLIAVRVLQGAAEAGYYPCIIYYLAFWFRPDQMARRVAVFYSFGQLSGFLGGFLAFAISHADGRLAGWRWLFIMDGIPAVLMGIVTFFFLPDYPQTAKFLNDDEKSAILGLLTEHSPSKEAKTWDWKQVVALVKNPSFWSWNLVSFFHAVGGFGLSFALPTVIFELGFMTPVQ